MEEGQAPVVLAGEVGAFLARHRPPACHGIELHVPAHAEIGPARHEAVLNVALAEVMSVWPTGTVLVVEYWTGRYAQALAYPPVLLTEIGQVTYGELLRAIELGWMDPLGVPAWAPGFQVPGRVDRQPGA